MNAHQIIHIAHILVMGPLLLAIGVGYILPSVYVSGIGIAIVLYHVFKMMQKGVNWVNLFHTLAVGPALIAYGSGAPRYVRELILMMGFAAIAYHVYYLL